MVNYVDISLDIETWGKRPGYDCRSIGACVFSLDGHETVSYPAEAWQDRHLDFVNHQFYIACDNPLTGRSSHDHFGPCERDLIDGHHRRYNLTRDPETVAWWATQSAEAQAAFADPVDLKECLVKLTQFVHHYSSVIRNGQAHDVRIWSHGAAFDPPYAEALYTAVGLAVPWFYRAPRDTRTAFDFALVDNHSALLARCNSGPSHHALYDAITQAKAVRDSYRSIHPPVANRDRFHSAP